MIKEDVDGRDKPGHDGKRTLMFTGIVTDIGEIVDRVQRCLPHSGGLGRGG